MLKVEQGRLNWGSNFTAVADKFLERKVRMSLKSRAYSADRYANYIPSNSLSPGKGFRNSINAHNHHYNGFNTTNSNSSLSVICRLWNSGFCSFGAGCKR